MAYPLKRRREFLEASSNHDSELVKFVLATRGQQAQLEEERLSSVGGISSIRDSSSRGSQWHTSTH